MLTQLRKIWEKHGFIISLVLSILIIISLALYQKGCKGTWSRSYIYNPTQPKPGGNPRGNSKRPPKESKGEAECRRVLQKYFNKPFRNVRPDFLRNQVTGGTFNLELDCYDDSLKLAVEYSGKQHYVYNSYMHKNKEAFYNQKYRDELKSIKCKEYRINLIVVSYKIKHHEIEEYLLRELIKLGYRPYFVQ